MLKHETLFDPEKAVITAEKIVSNVARGDEDQAAASMEAYLHLMTTELKRVVWNKKKALKPLSLLPE